MEAIAIKILLVMDDLRYKKQLEIVQVFIFVVRIMAVI